MGSSVPKRLSTIVWPRMQTFAALRTSELLKLRPEAIVQLRMSSIGGVVPSARVDQLLFP